MVVKGCTTCRWVGCRSYGRENGICCDKYIMSLEEERKIMIMKMAREDHLSKDTQYNNGLKAIRNFGYEHVVGNPDVEYWCMCNNL